MSRELKTVLDEHQRAVAAVEKSAHEIEHMIEAIVNCMRAGRRVYTIGNGGSAADAQHIACELLGRFKLERIAQPALALTTDSSTLTAIANDLGYDQIFARQLEGLLDTGDVVWLLSTSGNSPNIIAAAKTARTFGAMIIGFTGASGGELAPFCDCILRVQHGASDRIQEAHELVYHYICERVEEALA